MSSVLERCWKSWERVNGPAPKDTWLWKLNSDLFAMLAGSMPNGISLDAVNFPIFNEDLPDGECRIVPVLSHRILLPDAVHDERVSSALQQVMSHLYVPGAYAVRFHWPLVPCGEDERRMMRIRMAVLCR